MVLSVLHGLVVSVECIWQTNETLNSYLSGHCSLG